MNNPKPNCPYHESVALDIREIEKVQRARPCGEHEVRLGTLEKSDTEQWTAINQLRKSVWFGAGAAAGAALLGSALGTSLVSWLR